jgi:putative transposase
MEFPVMKMCQVFHVSPSRYYDWSKHPIGTRERYRQALLVDIKKMHDESKGRYGSPRITHDLRALGRKVSRPLVARIMRMNDIKSIVRKRYRVQTTDSTHAFTVSENLLNRDFTATWLGEKWVSDITYIPTREGWLYLTMILDLADRKVIGWAMSETMKTSDTTLPAMRMALRNRPLSDHPLLFHSDRGVQYACHEFRKLLKNTSIRQSMSRKGNCWDNAVAESFFKTLKTEMIYHTEYQTISKAKIAIFDYIESWYNRKRRHSALGYKAPVQREAELQRKQAA